MLPQLEQQALFNSANFSRDIYFDANTTLQATGLSVLWCPSDGLASQPRLLQGCPPMQVINYSSYTASTGLYYRHPPEPWTAASLTLLPGLNANCAGCSCQTFRSGSPT